MTDYRLPEAAKKFVDFAPGVVFLALFFPYGIFTATAGLLVSLVVQIIVYKIGKWPIPTYIWIILGIGLASGTLTLVLQDATFIKIRPTLVSAILVIIVLATQYIGEKNAFERILGSVMELSRRAWRAIAWIWCGLISANALLNLFIAFNASDEAWVWYKIGAAIGMPILIIACSVLYLYLTKQVPGLHDSQEPAT